MKKDHSIVWFLCLLACILGSAAPLPLPVRADGGAPNLAYISGTTPGLSTIDILHQKVTGTIHIGGDPQAVYLTLDGRFLYVTQPALDQVAMIATATGQIVCRAHVPGHPSLLAYDTTANMLFVAGNQAASVSELASSSCRVLRIIQTGSPIYGLAINIGAIGSSSDELWVAGENSITIFNTATTALKGNVPVPGGPRYLCIPPGLDVYATTRAGSLYVISPDTHRLLRLLSGGIFGPMDYDATTGEVYIPDLRHQQLDVTLPVDPNEVKTAPSEPGYRYRLNAAPQTVAITADGQLAFVGLNNGTVTMIDLPDRHVVTTWQVGGRPNFIITGLYPPSPGKSPRTASPQQPVTASPMFDIFALLLVAAVLVILIWLLLRPRHGRK